MKLKNLIACFFLGFIMVSCIQDEAPNAEADIIALYRVMFSIVIPSSKTRKLH